MLVCFLVLAFASLINLFFSLWLFFKLRNEL